MYNLRGTRLLDNKSGPYMTIKCNENNLHSFLPPFPTMWSTEAFVAKEMQQFIQKFVLVLILLLLQNQAST